MSFPLMAHAPKNLILASLPRQEYERLRPHLESVHLKKGQIICQAGEPVSHGYFTENGMLSLLSMTGRGEIVEVAMVGNEGMVGISLIMNVNVSPFQSNVQLSADAQRIRPEPLLEEFRRQGKLHDLLLKYTHGVLTQITQSALCNRFHTIEERLCRWLLTASDRTKSNTLELTQEFISEMLGIRRTGVTKAACALQDAGLIRYRRAKITITDRQKLEHGACECYRIVRKEVDDLRAA